MMNNTRPQMNPTPTMQPPPNDQPQDPMQQQHMFVAPGMPMQPQPGGVTVPTMRPFMPGQPTPQSHLYPQQRQPSQPGLPFQPQGPHPGFPGTQAPTAMLHHRMQGAPRLGPGIPSIPGPQMPQRNFGMQMNHQQMMAGRPNPTGIPQQVMTMPYRPDPAATSQEMQNEAIKSQHMAPGQPMPPGMKMIPISGQGPGQAILLPPNMAGNPPQSTRIPFQTPILEPSPVRQSPRSNPSQSAAPTPAPSGLSQPQPRPEMYPPSMPANAQTPGTRPSTATIQGQMNFGPGPGPGSGPGQTPRSASIDINQQHQFMDPSGSGASFRRPESRLAGHQQFAVNPSAHHNGIMMQESSMQRAMSIPRAPSVRGMSVTQQSTVEGSPAQLSHISKPFGITQLLKLSEALMQETSDEDKTSWYHWQKIVGDHFSREPRMVLSLLLDENHEHGKQMTADLTTIINFFHRCVLGGVKKMSFSIDGAKEAPEPGGCIISCGNARWTLFFYNGWVQELHVVLTARCQLEPIAHGLPWTMKITQLEMSVVRTNMYLQWSAGIFPQPNQAVTLLPGPTMSAGASMQGLEFAKMSSGANLEQMRRKAVFQGELPAQPELTNGLPAGAMTMLEIQDTIQGFDKLVSSTIQHDLPPSQVLTRFYNGDQPPGPGQSQQQQHQQQLQQNFGGDHGMPPPPPTHNQFGNRMNSMNGQPIVGMGMQPFPGPPGVLGPAGGPRGTLPPTPLQAHQQPLQPTPKMANKAPQPGYQNGMFPPPQPSSSSLPGPSPAATANQTPVLQNAIPNASPSISNKPPNSKGGKVTPNKDGGVPPSPRERKEAGATALKRKAAVNQDDGPVAKRARGKKPNAKA